MVTLRRLECIAKALHVDLYTDERQTEAMSGADEHPISLYNKAVQCKGKNRAETRGECRVPLIKHSCSNNVSHLSQRVVAGRRIPQSREFLVTQLHTQVGKQGSNLKK